MSLSKCQTNLPASLAPLIGRTRELKTARAYLRGETRLLTLSGPAGVGKTRLALQVAAELLGLFVDGIFLVELAPIRDPDLVAPTIAQVLGIAEEPGQPVLATLGEHLHNQRILLLLDNFEHVIGAAGQINDLLAAAPSLTLMVTSREVLRIYGEQEFPVPPLELPNSERLPPLEILDRNEAIALFVARAQLVKPDFQLTQHNAQAVVEVCHRLDGLPLAIELAAARCKILAPPTLLARLENRLGLLESVARVRIPRLQTLRDAIAWSYDLLDAGDQALFVHLAVFRGGCTLVAAEAVCGDGRESAGDEALCEGSSIPDRLTSLVDKSLLRRIEDDDGMSRFSMLQTIREYALEQLTKRNEVERFRQEHAAYFLQLAEQAEQELTGAEQTVWLARLEREHDNFRAALQWAMEHDHVYGAARMAGALWRFWFTRGHLSEGRRWLERALTLVEPAQDTGEASVAQSWGPDRPPSSISRAKISAKLLTGAGRIAWLQGAYAQAYDYLESSLALYQELGDQLGIAQMLNSQGVVAFDQEDYQRAVALYTKSLAMFRALNHTQGIADTLNNLGIAMQFQGDAAQAHDMYAETLALRRESGDKYGIAIVLINLGELALQQGDAAQAHTYYSEGLALSDELGARDNVAYCLEGLADVAAARGQVAEAARLWGAAEELREAFGMQIAPIDRARREASVAHVRMICDDETWISAWTAGRSMTLAQAIAEALAQI